MFNDRGKAYEGIVSAVSRTVKSPILVFDPILIGTNSALATDPNEKLTFAPA